MGEARVSEDRGREFANNFGPTDTHALLVGSVAIDAGQLAECPPTDQRGFPRPELGGTDCDSGAFELPEPNTSSMLRIGILLLIALARRRGSSR